MAASPRLASPRLAPVLLSLGMACGEQAGSSESREPLATEGAALSGSLSGSVDAPVDGVDDPDVLEAGRPGLTKLELQASLASLEPMEPAEGAALLFEHVRLTDDGELLDQSKLGGLTLEEETAAARPYRHLHEPFLYQEESWTLDQGQGWVEHGVRVWRIENSKPAVAPELLEENQPGPATWGEDIEALLQKEWAEEELQPVTVTLRNFPEWDAPLRPREWIVGKEKAAIQSAARDAWISQRKQLFAERTKELASEMKALGAEVGGTEGRSAWVSILVNKPALLALTQRDDLRTISLDLPDLEPGGEVGEDDWALGEGREDSRTDVGDYLRVTQSQQTQYDGGGPNDTQPLRIAFIEGGKFRVGACAFKNGANCTGSSRIYKQFRCNLPGTPYCQEEPTNGDLQGSDDGNHGTLVVAAAIADYTEGQGTGQTLGPATSWPGWQERASGFAPEATAILFGRADGDADTLRIPQHAKAFELGVDHGADIISFSQGSGEQRCHPSADLSSEAAAEDAFDDGVLVVACTGNHGPTTAICDTTCGTWSVGSLAKTLSVGGFRAHVGNCAAGDQASCRRHYCVTRDPNGFCTHAFGSCLGGATVKINNTFFNGQATLTDLLMATNISHVTDFGDGDDGTYPKGYIRDTYHVATGCSTATPQVAGIAASVKDYHLQAGHTWVDSPGRLQSLMLAMGDRATSATDAGPITQRATGASPGWGVGRLKARYWPESNLQPLLRTTLVHSFTPSSGPLTFVPFGLTTPLPTGTDLVKCTLLQMEDLTGEATPVSISDIDLRIDLHGGFAGACGTVGIGIASASDTRADWKKMVSLTSAQQTLAGRCVSATLTPTYVEPQGVSTVLTCVYSGALETEG